MKKVLVTGGAGYIGGHTIIELVRNNFFSIESLDNFSNSFPINLSYIEQSCNHEFTNNKIDITNYDKLNELFATSSFEAVIHFAGLKSVPESFKKHKRYEKVNVQGTENLLKLCRLHNVNKFIFSSTCAVYGDARSPVNEKSKIEPLSPYAKTKYRAEELIQKEVLENLNFKAIILRYFNPIGADKTGLYGENSKAKNKSLINELHNSYKKNYFTIFGKDYDTKDGTPVRDFIHVSDLAKAHVLALKKSQNKKSEKLLIYNVGSGYGFTVKEIVQEYADISNTNIPIRISKRRRGDIEKIYADISKIKKELNWKPKNTIIKMIESAFLWKKNQR